MPYDAFNMLYMRLVAAFILSDNYAYRGGRYLQYSKLTLLIGWHSYLLYCYWLAMDDRSESSLHRG